MSNRNAFRTTTLVSGAFLIITVLIVSIVVVSTNGLTDRLAFAQGARKKFTADLSGKNEVPPVDTKASGTAQFQLSADGKEINYELNVKGMNNFMMAHIHQGKSGENGQPVVMLSMGKAKITPGDLQGPLNGKQLSDLVKLLEDGNAYVNVHTQQNQNGEIRGQIKGS
ncbi:MAG: CHRD domain-containing protein [Nitrososphaeraceae archaeon]